MPRRREERAPRSIPISIEIESAVYHGSYSVSRGMLTVRSADGSKTTQVGGTPADTLARVLLAELARQSKD
jgi:hypothetical protein